MIEGACDCHVHVYGLGFALAPTATFQPPPAPASAYREVQRKLGLDRVVIVQPTGYGFDNSCTLAAIAELGEGARGVAVVAVDVPDAELDRLHAGGMRGVRFMMLPGGVLPWSALEPLAKRLAPRAWHVDLQLDGRDFRQHEQRLLDLPCRLVIDHIGKFLEPVETGSESFRSLCRVLDGGNVWVKLSAPYESSRSGPPRYEDVEPIARELALRYPKRCLWGSNWPHPNVKPVPDEHALLDWSLALLDGGATWAKAMLADNPAHIYGFD
ncbi:amidohydrolase [Variovorax sp. Sphag1AA]|uniref:amidohydrolase family protein n=1 Tax=Variovorax sp. Sphag1AA TaxID=2587027 RepID=UPI0017EB287C|nr:amidohydrolase family protein [Variovorax sp. Sphag1AA]MBB3178753.1 D-galactarolactone isomerase [Variovorax sp. Sphag1AA]